MPDLVTSTPHHRGSEEGDEGCGPRQCAAWAPSGWGTPVVCLGDSDTLGFTTLVDAPVDQLGGRWIEVTPPKATITIALIPAGAAAPSGVNTGIRFTTEDAAALHAQLVTNGVDIDDLIVCEHVPPMFDFRDPDGNVLYVSELARR